MKKFLFLGWCIMWGCTPKMLYPPTITPSIVNPKAKIVADIVFQISAGKKKVFYYKFADGDTIIFNAWTIKGKNIGEISIVKWPESVVFNAWTVPAVENKRIFVEKKAIYAFSFKNEGVIWPNTYKFTLHRIPTNEKFLNFNTVVKWKTIYDTTYVTVVESTLVRIDTVPEKIIDTQIKVGSQLTSSLLGNETRAYIKISLPEETSYWVYWIGVGQEAVKKLEEMGRSLSKVLGIMMKVEPVEAFAIGLIPELYTLNKGHDINFYFLPDYENAMRFISGNSFYYFKKGEKIITDYAKMERPKRNTFYLGIDNSYSIATAKLVTIKVVAVKIIPKYKVQQVQKPIIKRRYIPILEE